MSSTRSRRKRIGNECEKSSTVRSSYVRSESPGRYHLRVRDTQRGTDQVTAQQLPADPLASAVARSVSDLRHSAGLSERAAARKLGTSQTQLRRMEDPRYLPSLRSLARLATVYGYELKVDFTQKGSLERGSRGGGKAAAARTKDATVKPTTKPKARASASASPSKARAGAPRRGRAGARATARRAAPRRRS